jgi:Bacterial sugar transferase
VTVLWRRLFSFVSTWPAFMERVLVLGDGILAQDLLKEIHERPDLGIRVVAHISEDQDWSSWQRPGMPAFAAEIDRVTRVLRVRRIIVSMKERRGRLPVESLLELKKRGVIVQDGNELYQVLTGKFSLDSLRPSMLLFSPGFQVSRPFLLYKRIFSLVFSAVALLLTFPLMLLIAVAIKLDSTGPVIFRQRRVGKDGKIFMLYKFRSMYVGVDGDRPATEDDARCTRVGRWLRATRIDELLQS